MAFEKIKENRNINTCVKILLYLFSVILVIFYIFVLVLSIFKTNVSWEYDLYYISDEADIWVGENGYDYILGTKLETNMKNMENCKRLGKGWGAYWEEGVWSSKEESKIYFTNLPSKQLVFEMIVQQCLINESIEIYFNDNLVNTISAWEIKETKLIKEKVKSEYIQDGRLIVTLKYNKPLNNEEDKTLRSIMCKEINLYEDR